MARVKRDEQVGEEELWAAYRAIQLTPEQKAVARGRAEKRAEEAARHGVFQRVLELVGDVHFDKDDLEDLRRDRD